MISYQDLQGNVIEEFPIINCNKRIQKNTHLSNNEARRAFGRGLSVTNDNLIIGGSSSGIYHYINWMQKTFKTIYIIIHEYKKYNSGIRNMAFLIRKIIFINLSPFFFYPREKRRG